MDYEAMNSWTAAAQVTAERLRGLDLHELSLSPLGSQQMARVAQDPLGHLMHYCQLMTRLHEILPRKLSQIHLVDYGGGPGLLSLLAKERGVGRVTYVDIHAPSRDDAQVIGSALGRAADEYLAGDVHTLASYCAETRRYCNAVVSYDVLEHIYDLTDFFSAVPRLSGGERLCLVMGTGANIHNPRSRRSEMRKQRSAEYEDQPKKWGAGQRDTLSSYYKVRCNIIRTSAPELPEARVEWLSRRMRGLAGADIERCLEEYKATGQVLYEPDHPTNTCCPTTGFWVEHLVPAGRYLAMLRAAGLVGRVTAGRYPLLGRRRSLKWLANAAITMSGRFSLSFAPFLVVEGVVE